MDFAEDKTRTWHNHDARWTIRATEHKIKFLGYIINKPEQARRKQSEDWSAHIANWQTKGNQVYNII